MLYGLWIRLFNEGYKASSGDRLVREDLCYEAIGLMQLVVDHPVTRTPRSFALLVLMCPNAARLSARTDDAGNLLSLHHQNRSAWEPHSIARGIENLRLAASGNEVSVYHTAPSLSPESTGLKLAWKRWTPSRTAASSRTAISTMPCGELWLRSWVVSLTLSAIFARPRIWHCFPLSEIL